MFFTLLVITFVLALLVSVILVRVFSHPIERILKRIIADAIHEAWLKYLKFTICVVGVSSSVRIHELERYITPARYGREEAGRAHRRADHRTIVPGRFDSAVTYRLQCHGCAYGTRIPVC